MKIAHMAFALVMSAAPSLMGCFSVAQADEDLRIPETTRILRFESHQTCPDCPAYFYELYADGSWHYEGIDAVFRLGEDGTKRFWDGFRKEPTPTDPRVANSEGARFRARQILDRYRVSVASDERPDSESAQLLQAIRSANFEAWRSEYPSGLGDGAGSREPVFSIQIDLDRKSKAVKFLASSAPPDLARLVDQILTNGHAFLVGPGDAIQRTPTFRGDQDAELWIAKKPTRLWKAYGVILYRSGKATIFGWNHVGLRDRGFQTHSVQLDPAQVGKVLADLRNVEWRPLSSHVYSNPDDHSIVDVVLGGRFPDYRLILKGRSGRLQGSARTTLEELKRIVESMEPLLGPNDPARRHPAAPPLPASSAPRK